MSLAYLYSKVQGYVLPGTNPCNTQPVVVPNNYMCIQDPVYVVPGADECPCPSNATVGVPTAPLNLVCTYAGAGTGQFTWNVPTGGGAVDYYTLYYIYDSDPDNRYILYTANPFITVDSLGSGLIHFAVTASNGSGEGPESNWVDVTFPLSNAGSFSGANYTYDASKIGNGGPGYDLGDWNVPLDFDTYDNPRFTQSSGIGLSGRITAASATNVNLKFWMQNRVTQTEVNSQSLTTGVGRVPQNILPYWTTNKTWFPFEPGTLMSLYYIPSGLAQYAIGNVSFSFTYNTCAGTFNPAFAIVPQTPGDFRYVYIGTDTIQLTWTDAEEATDYYITYSSPSGGGTQQIQTANNYYTFTGLIPNANYKFDLVSYNGLSSPPTTLNLTTNYANNSLFSQNYIIWGFFEPSPNVFYDTYVPSDFDSRDSTNQTQFANAGIMAIATSFINGGTTSVLSMYMADSGGILTQICTLNLTSGINFSTPPWTSQITNAFQPFIKPGVHMTLVITQTDPSQGQISNFSYPYTSCLGVYNPDLA